MARLPLAFPARGVWLAALVGVCALMLGGCASGAVRATGAAPAAPATASAAARGAARPRVLEVLPRQATIAWVRPSDLLADAMQEDDASVGTGEVRSMRLDVEAVLKGEGWRVVAADSAQFIATLALRRRTTFESQRRQVQGTEVPTPRCDATRTGGVCPPAPKPRYQTASVAVSTTVAFLRLRRQADGAQREWTHGYDDHRVLGGLFAREMILALRSGAAK